jgi:hypothetical protein
MAKKDWGTNAEIWQRGFADHRIRGAEDYEKHLKYIHLNPVKKHLCIEPGGYRYSSAYPGWKLDPFSQVLMPPEFILAGSGTTQVAPFQNHLPALNLAQREATMALPESLALKGLDFSRAEETGHKVGALAPEGAER